MTQQTKIDAEKVIDENGMNEYTINVMVSNTIQPRQYEAAKRDVFISKKLRIRASATMAEEHAAIENETRRMAAMAEAEAARIVAKFAEDQNLPELVQSLWKRYTLNWIDQAKIMFGFSVTKQIPTREALPAKGLHGAAYVLKDTGEILKWTGKWESAAPAQG